MTKALFKPKHLKNAVRDLWIRIVENRGLIPESLPDSSVTLDIVIPCIEKDLPTLPYVVASAREYIRHPINRIYIVGPPSKAVENFCIKSDCTFVNEASVLPVQKKDIDYVVRGKDRSGWLFQQFLKFGIADKVEQPFYLVMDADTVLIRPHTFQYQSKTIFFYATYLHQPYFRTYEKLLNKQKVKPFSFVAHYMLFERENVKKLCDHLKSINQKDWYNAILDTIDSQENSFFSEYETYGNYVATEFPEKALFLRADNISFAPEQCEQLASLRRIHCHHYRSISFHNWA